MFVAVPPEAPSSTPKTLVSPSTYRLEAFTWAPSSITASVSSPPMVNSNEAPTALLPETPALGSSPSRSFL